MAEIRIRLFGAFEIAHGDAAPQHPASERVVSLLGYLVVHHDVPQRREQLIEALWPDLDEEQGRRALSDTLWRARRLLTPPGRRETPAVRVSGDTLTLRSGGEVWVDLIAFKEHLACAEASQGPQAIAHLASAVELYRGELLVDCQGDWLDPERTHAEVSYTGALRRLLGHYKELRAHEQALAIVLRLLGLDELDEEIHRDLIRLYYLLGRDADALRAFEHCREQINREPEPATLALYEELAALQQRRAGVRPAPAEEADPGSAISAELPFVGRAPQRAALVEAVEQAIAGAGGMLLVAGVAGIGKSRLLREVAGAAAWRGAEVCWGYAHASTQATPFSPLREALGAALTPLRAQQVAQVLPAARLRPLLPLLPQLDVAPPGVPPASGAGEPQAEALHPAIAELLRALGTVAPHVLVLEDAHWFDSATLAALVAVLPTLRDARVLILLSGRADELPQRPEVWAAIQQLDRLGSFQHVDLECLALEDCASLVQRALLLRQPSRPFVDRLHTLTGGNPFFLLETLRGLYEEGLLRREAGGQWQLPWTEPDTPVRIALPESLQGVILERAARLSTEDHALLTAAAVLDQDFAPATAILMLSASRSVGDAPAHASEPGVVFARLHDLVQRQFLHETATSYRFAHHTIREVLYGTLRPEARQALHLRAAEVLAEAPQPAAATLARHCVLAGAWARAFPYLVAAGDQAAAVHDLHGALGHYDQALEAAAQLAEDAGHRRACCALQLKRGRVATARADYLVAIAAYEAALSLAEGASSPLDGTADAAAMVAARIDALNGLSMVYGLRNEYAHASDAIQRAVRLAREYAGAREQADVLFQAGAISFRMDDFALARRSFQKAMALYDRLGAERDLARCLHDIGACHLRQEGPTDQVIDHYTRALAIYQRQGDRFAEHQCQLEIANTCLTRGRLPAALGIAEQCLHYFRKAGALDEVAWSLFLRGEASRRLGERQAAVDALSEAIAISRRLKRGAAALFSQVYLAATLRDTGAYAEAMQLLEPALAAEDRSTSVRALLVATEILSVQGQLEPAWFTLEQALDLAQDLGARARQGIAYRLLARLRVADRALALPPPSATHPAAEECLARSQALLRAAHYDDELAHTAVMYGRLLARERRVDEAKAQLIRARVLFWQCGMERMLTTVDRLLAPLGSGPPALLPGQSLVTLARRDAPRGRVLRPEEQVEIVWPVERSDQGQAGRGAAQPAWRRTRLRLLCDEAAAQGAEPTVEDLAQALGVSFKTVQRDLNTLRAAGELIMTRGTS